jgi:hypothetical protein
MRSHPATAQGTANVASLRLLADFNRGIANRMIKNATTAIRSIAMACEYICFLRALWTGEEAVLTAQSK